MEDVDRPAHIHALPEPAGARRPRVEAKTLRVVIRPKDLANAARGLRQGNA
jgi:hypothetical protein